MVLTLCLLGRLFNGMMGCSLRGAALALTRGFFSEETPVHPCA